MKSIPVLQLWFLADSDVVYLKYEQRLITNFTWKAVFVETSPTCFAQNLLLVSFVIRACGNIAHGPFAFVVNR